MIEKVNPKHPDKIADRIAGAIVDLAYTKEENPKIAVEVLLGHGIGLIIAETSVKLEVEKIGEIVKRISEEEEIKIFYKEVPQDKELAKNQKDKIRCGDNGIFKGTPLTNEEKCLGKTAREIYKKYNSDGKYILDLNNNKLIICQSKVDSEELKKEHVGAIVNPLGNWTGGINVDTGATNRKLGSDMGAAVTGGGLHGKDLSKADVSVNIYAFLKAQETGEPIELSCAIGDEEIDGRPYEEIVRIARTFINKVGGFEKFAEWGLF